MATIKLIVTDLDGTFLADAYAPHPENVRAMRACQEAGIPVCALTGRNWAECKKIVLGANFDRFCGINNGTAIVDTRTGELRYRNRFHPDAVQGLIDFALALQGVGFAFAGTNQTHNLKTRRMTPYLDPASAYLEDESVAPIVLYDTQEQLAESCKSDAQRMFLDLPNADEATIGRVYDLANRVTPVDIISYNDGIEVVPQGASKSDALSVLADIYNVRMQNVMAFGDNVNDFTMLQTAGIGVAMENGDTLLKDLADCIAPPNTVGGFARIVWRFVL